MREFLFLALAAGIALPADNILSPEESRAGWILLFDGRTMRGWRDPAGENPPGDSWAIEDGCLTTRPRPRVSEDLVSEDSYGDFELVFDWRVSPGGNTGVKYRIQRLIFIDNTKAQNGPGGLEGLVGREVEKPRSDRAQLAPGATAQEYSVAFEMQLLDDERHPDARQGADRRTGALYRMIPATSSPARPAGEWNNGRIVVQGDHVEHWINGSKVLDGSLSSPQARDGAVKRWMAAPAVGRMLVDAKPPGPVSLQHHGDPVWFRNVKLRRL